MSLSGLWCRFWRGHDPIMKREGLRVWTECAGCGEVSPGLEIDPVLAKRLAYRKRTPAQDRKITDMRARRRA